MRASRRMVKPEPTALAAGDEATDVAPVGPAASAVGSHDVRFSPSQTKSACQLAAQQKCSTLPPSILTQAIIWTFEDESVANNRTTMLRYDDVDAMVTALKLVCQNLAAKNSFSAFDQARRRTFAARRHTCRYLVLATCHRIGHAPANFDRSGRTADRCRLATISGFLKTSE